MFLLKLRNLVIGVDTVFVQAFGAVAPKRKTNSKRVTAVIGATALAMAITALILLSSQSSVSARLSPCVTNDIAVVRASMHS